MLVSIQDYRRLYQAGYSKQDIINRIRKENNKMNIDYEIRRARNVNGKMHNITKPVEILRGCMGSGKTYHTLRELDKNAQTLFVVENLENVDTISKEHDFLTPIEALPRKEDHLKEVLLSGRSCICTHELFRRIDSETREIIREMQVHCIIDELLNSTIEIKGIPSDDDSDAPILAPSARVMLDATKALDIDPDTHVVSWNKNKLPKPMNMGVLDDLYAWAEAGVLLWYPTKDESLSGYVVTTFPVETLEAFESVKMLCYGFEGLPIQGYLELLGIPYIFNDRFLENEEEDLKRLKERINIITEHPVMNLLKSEAEKINKEELSLSSTCWKYLISDDLAKKIGACIDKTLDRKKIPTSKSLWTSYKRDMNRISSGFKNRRLNSHDSESIKKAKKGSVQTFTNWNLKGTNQFDDREMMINLCCPHIHPNLKRFFSYNGIELDDNAFILENVIQWMMRGCARDRDSEAVMNVLITSPKARKLVIEWLDKYNQ